MYVVVVVVFFGGVLFYKKNRKAKKDFAVVDKNKFFFRVDFGQGLALNQVTGPVNWVPEKKGIISFQKQ